MIQFPKPDRNVRTTQHNKGVLIWVFIATIFFMRKYYLTVSSSSLYLFAWLNFSWRLLANGQKENTMPDHVVVNMFFGM